MSKTTPKSTKKPTQLDRIEALAKSAHAESGLAHAATLALQQRIDAMRHEQAALSQGSRSAPAEEWVPKVDREARPCYVVRIGDLGIGGTPIGTIGKVLTESDHDYNVEWATGITRDVSKSLTRPATSAEIASHKAKEEQRAKEAEWAKYTEIQNHDTIAWTTKQERDELLDLFREAGFRVANGPESYKSHTLIVDIDPEWAIDIMCDSRTADLPFAEGKRRLRGTIAKRAEEERAKEMAKPLEFGTRVNTVKFLPDALPVTVIIGGKAWTEEEHEAEFQRRAKVMLEAGNEMRRIIAICMNIGIDTMYATQAWDEATIQLP